MILAAPAMAAPLMEEYSSLPMVERVAEYSYLNSPDNLKRMKKYNCSERPKSTPLPPPKQQG